MPFLRAWAVTLAALAVVIVCVTVVVDPYGIFNMPRIKGWTANKPAAPHWPRLSKPYLLEAANPATLVLGSSTVDLGIDPEGPAWPDARQPVFNLGIEMAKPATQLLYLRNALATTSPKLVLIGASFDDAMIMPASHIAGASTAVPELAKFDNRLRLGDSGEPNLDYRLGQIQNAVFATLSFQALRDSIKTLSSQRDPFANVLTRLGFDTGGPFVRWIADEGQNAFFLDKDAYKAHDLVKWRPQPALAVQPVLDAVALAQQHGATVIVFLLPTHADNMELLRQVGLTNRYHAWKTELVAAIEHMAQNRERVPVWDFGGFTPYTTEPVPLKGDTTHQLRWFWDLVHFRPELGDLMLQWMLDQNGPGDLGVQVTSAGLPARAAAYEDAQRTWIAAHPADVARIAGIMDAAVRNACLTAPNTCTVAGRETATR